MSEETPKSPPRIGVFVCHCGKNIGGVVDVPSVAKFAEGLPNVVFSTDNLYTCAEDGLTCIKDAVVKHNLNRVVVASCTPRTHAPLFMSAIEEAGLNQYLFEFVNIRDQCSWVHMKEPEKATKKAMILVEMGVRKASLLEALEEKEIAVEPSALVIGGGVAGMVAALGIADHGFQVHIVEREERLGGLIGNIEKVYPVKRAASSVISDLERAVRASPMIEVHTSSTVKDAKGYVGNYDVEIQNGGASTFHRIGAIIVATGATEFKPEGMYSYGEDGRILTQLELERQMREGKVDGVKSVAMIQCVAARGEKFTYCSKMCCSVAIKNAIELKTKQPAIDVSILYNDIQMPGEALEKVYTDAREMGIKFLRFPLKARPQVVADGGLAVRFFNESLGADDELRPDLVVLSAPLVPREGAKELSRMLKVPLGQDGFFFEAHVKLRPLDFATDGVYLCGTAHGPKGLQESISQAMGAASRALIPLSNGKVRGEAAVAFADEATCIGCGNCVKVCPYVAIDRVERNGRFVAVVNSALCKACGTCVPACPSGAMTQKSFTDSQLLEMVDAVSQEEA